MEYVSLQSALKEESQLELLVLDGDYLIEQCVENGPLTERLSPLILA